MGLSKNMSRQSKLIITLADFCKPANMKTEPKLPEHNIDAAYERLKAAGLFPAGV